MNVHCKEPQNENTYTFVGVLNIKRNSLFYKKSIKKKEKKYKIRKTLLSSINKNKNVTIKLKNN